MLKNYFNKKSQLSFILLWIFLWLSIGTYPIKKNFFYDTFSVTEIFFQLRLYAPLIIFSVIAFTFLIKKNNFKFNNKLWFFLFILIFLFQAIGLIFNEERNFEPISWIFIIYSLIVCFIISNLKIINLKKIYFINLIFIFIAFIIFINPVYISFFNLDEDRMIMYGFSKWDNETFGSPNVRVTGIARYCLIISIFLYAYLITQNNKKFLTIFIPLFLIYFFVLNIWMLQSRLVVGSLFIVFCSTLFLRKKNYNNFVLIGFFSIICLTVYVSSHGIQVTKKNLLLAKMKKQIIFDYQEKQKKVDFKNQNNLNKGETEVNEEIVKTEKKENISEIELEISEIELEKVADIELEKKIENKKLELEKKKVNRISEITTSGRTKIWTELITSYDISKFFGYGVQADRFLLIDPDRNLSTNASNAILYVFVSGGYFATIIFIIIIVKSILLNLKILIKNWKNVNINFFDMVAYLQINFFLIRQLVENSFAVFSVDLMLFATSFFYLIRRLEK